MSTLFTQHAVTSYVSGQTKPLDGQRLSKVTYKTDSKTGLKPSSKAVSIPVIGWNEVQPHLTLLADNFLSVVHRAQDGIVRGLIEAGKLEISQEDISISSIVAAMLDESSGRLTGDAIRAWFNESVHDPLMIAFAPKLGIGENDTPTAEQEAKLVKILKGYEDSFAKLASGAASFNDLQKSNMIKAMELITDADSDILAVKFTERLLKKNDDDLLMSL